MISQQLWLEKAAGKLPIVWQHLTYHDTWQTSNPTYPIFARNIFSHEIFLDVDVKKEYKDNTVPILENWLTLNLPVLQQHNIPAILGFSGGGIHVEIFFKTSKTISLAQFKQYAANKKNYFTGSDFDFFCRQIRFEIQNSLRSMLKPIDGIKIDNFHKKSRHMIREYGSCNPKNNRYKTLIQGSKLKVVEKPEDVVFPEVIEYWDIPQELIDRCAEKVVKNTRPVNATIESKDRIEWVEVLHQKPLPDARERLIGLVFAPYCVNVLGLSDDQSFSWIKEWTDVCQFKYNLDQISDSFIRSKVAFARRQGYRVARWSRVKSMLRGEEA